MPWTADNSNITCDAIWWTADGAILLGDKSTKRTTKLSVKRRTFIVKKARRTLKVDI